MGDVRNFDVFDRAQVVMLGEPWNGDGGAISLKGKLVEYLHEKKGFDVLIFESDFYSLHEGWKQAKLAGKIEQIASENIYPFWSQSWASSALWNYVSQQLQTDHPLYIAGMDTRPSGRIARTKLPADLREHLTKMPGVSKGDAARAAAILEIILNAEIRTNIPVTTDDLGFLLKLTIDLERYLQGRSDEPFWQQASKSLHRFLTEPARDPGMGENLIWLASQLYPGRKIIVWSQTSRVNTNKWMFYDAPENKVQPGNFVSATETMGRSVYLGDIARAYFGQRVYSIATTPYEGTYSSSIEPSALSKPADFFLTKRLSPPTPETLEGALALRGHNVAFLNLRPFRGTVEPVLSRVWGYNGLSPISMRLWDGFDGLLFIKTTHGLNEVPVE